MLHGGAARHLDQSPADKEAFKLVGELAAHFDLVLGGVVAAVGFGVLPDGLQRDERRFLAVQDNGSVANAVGVARVFGQCVVGVVEVA